jgi:hypothetical protein
VKISPHIARCVIDEDNTSFVEFVGRGATTRSEKATVGGAVEIINRNALARIKIVGLLNILFIGYWGGDFTRCRTAFLFAILASGTKGKIG